jgi:hypothetical protein
MDSVEAGPMWKAYALTMAIELGVNAFNKAVKIPIYPQIKPSLLPADVELLLWLKSTYTAGNKDVYLRESAQDGLYCGSQGCFRRAIMFRLRALEYLPPTQNPQGCPS